MTTISGRIWCRCDHEVEARRDVQRVDERRARVAGRSVQQVDDGEPQRRLRAVGRRQVHQRPLRAAAEGGAAERQRRDRALRGRRHGGHRRAEAAVQHVVVHVAREGRETERRDRAGDADHRRARDARRRARDRRQRRHGTSIARPSGAGRPDRLNSASAPHPPIERSARTAAEASTTIGACPGSA